MRSLFSCLAVCVALQLFPAGAQADVAPPPPPGKRVAPAQRPASTAKGTPLTVTYEAGKPARLVIPRKLLEDLDAQQAPAGSASAGPARSTIVAGVALSLAAVSLVFIGRRSRGGAAAAVFLVVVITATCVTANGVPFLPKVRGDDPSKFAVQIELVDQGDSIQLVVDHPLHVAPPAEPTPEGATESPTDK